jgi:hypothetical protein
VILIVHLLVVIKTITSSGAASPKFLIPVFSAKVKGKKFMPCKYFVMFSFTFFLRISSTEIKTFRNVASQIAW